MNVGFLGAPAVVPGPDGLTDAVEEAGPEPRSAEPRAHRQTRYKASRIPPESYTIGLAPRPTGAMANWEAV